MGCTKCCGVVGPPNVGEVGKLLAGKNLATGPGYL